MENLSNDKVILVILKKVYGLTKAYPANAVAHRIAHLNGTKTLTLDTLLDAQAIGFTLVARHASGEKMEFRLA